MSEGVRQLRHEMARQHRDAAQTLADGAEPATAIAERIRARGRLALLGMGGSHWINRAACPAYRAAGIDATCHVVSEFIRAPLPGDPALLVTSQSGASGEIVRLLDLGLAGGAAFGLTLAPESPLAMRLPGLIGAGGPEQAYAATRSLLVTLAQHAAILGALGEDISDVEAALSTPAAADPQEREAAITRIAGCRAGAMVARGPQQGAMDAAALCLMEIARIPVLGLEAGQFRHGPFEMIGEETAVVMLRSAGPTEDDLAGLAGECLHHGIVPVVFDASGGDPLAGAVTVTLPPASGLALSVAALPVVQDVLVAAADLMVAEAGLPRRSTKVTSGEAA